MNAEQLGEILADFEVRISTLENSMPRSHPPHENKVTVKEIRYDQQLEARVKYLQDKLQEINSILLKKRTHTNIKGLTNVYKG